MNTGTPRTLSSAVLLFVGIVASLATVLGFLGSVSWQFDRLADWRFPLMVVLAITAIAYGFISRNALSAVFLLAAFVNAGLVAPLLLSAQPVTTSNDRIRIVSLDTTGVDDDRSDIVTWIDETEADVALLFRTSDRWGDVVNAAGVPYRIVAVPTGSEALGPAIVLAHEGTAVTPLEPIAGSDVTVQVGIGSTTVTVVGVAAQNPGSSAEADRRIERFKTINTAVSMLDEPIVITGNFETSRWSRAFGVLTEGMTNSEDGFGYDGSWPASGPLSISRYAGLPLDHTVYRGDITVPTRRTGPGLGPTHRPLIFDLSNITG